MHNVWSGSKSVVTFGLIKKACSTSAQNVNLRNHLKIHEVLHISLYQIFSFNLLEGNMDSLDFSNFDRKKKSVMEEIGNGKSKNSKLELQTTGTGHHIFLYIFLAGF